MVLGRERGSCLDDPIVTSQRIFSRWSKESFQHRLASGIIAVTFDITGSNEPIHVTPFVSYDIDDADSRE